MLRPHQRNQHGNPENLLSNDGKMALPIFQLLTTVSGARERRQWWYRNTVERTTDFKTSQMDVLCEEWREKVDVIPLLSWKVANWIED